MGNCNCRTGSSEEGQYVFDSSTKESFLSSLKRKYSKENNSSINQISSEEFLKLLCYDTNVKEVLEKYSPCITTRKFTSSSISSFPSSSNQLDDCCVIDPIKITFLNDGLENYYHGCINKNGDFHGQGILIIPDKYIYSGNFKNGEFSGKGLLIKKNGDYYYGDWVDNACCGEGFLKVNGQYEYSGHFEKNKKNGYGFETYPDNTRYEGEFKDNQKWGKGKTFLKNGEKYEGDYENNLYNGKGVYTWPKDGRVYRGEFKNGNMEGKGKNKFKDGSEYIGYYKGGIKNGEGIYSWPDGRKFKGYWVNGKINGVGRYIVDGKEKYDINFRFGKIISTKSDNDNINDNNIAYKRVKFSKNDVINKENIANIDDYICPICNYFIYNPVYCLSCLRNFCEDCIKQNNEEDKNNCPNCNGENIESNSNMLANLIQKISFNCEKCNRVINYIESLNHYH